MYPQLPPVVMEMAAETAADHSCVGLLMVTVLAAATHRPRGPRGRESQAI